jgi:hypothetical protein
MATIDAAAEAEDAGSRSLWRPWVHRPRAEGLQQLALGITGGGHHRRGGPRMTDRRSRSTTQEI